MYRILLSVRQVRAGREHCEHWGRNTRHSLHPSKGSWSGNPSSGVVVGSRPGEETGFDGFGTLGGKAGSHYRWLLQQCWGCERWEDEPQLREQTAEDLPAEAGERTETLKEEKTQPNSRVKGESWHRTLEQDQTHVGEGVGGHPADGQMRERQMDRKTSALSQYPADTSAVAFRLIVMATASNRDATKTPFSCIFIGKGQMTVTEQLKVIERKDNVVFLLLEPKHQHHFNLPV